MNDGVDIRLLGPVRWYLGGQPLPTGGPLTRTLLAVLTVNRRNTMSPKRLAQTVWDGDPPPSYRSNLHNRIAEARAALSAAGAAATSILRTDDDGHYCLDIADEQCDLGRFEQARARALAAYHRGDHDDAAAQFRLALAQWSGDALDGLPESSFTDAFIVHVSEERRQVVEARLDLDLAAGRASEILGELRVLAARHPLRESLWLQLITALYLSERHAEALDACRTLRRALRESGMDPGARLAELEQRILRGEPVRHEPRIRLRPGVGGEDPTLLETLGHYLLYVDDGRRFEVRGPLTIGRSIDNDVRLADAKTSRYHARLAPDGDELRIEDLDSANGVYVNDTRIRGPVRLTTGDRLRIGSMTLQVRRPLG
ncbi:response regulator transcription factor EmbR [Nocardia sp. JMUB6875]|uniref:BTAD domain-containing putative transcriptional regulator n=1 Tax=Nocardia sp. JMUB6875 TaxID=3158170 RepID=UPI0032E7B3A8